MIKIQINNENQMKQFAKKYSQTLKGGEIILLNGDLGAGKTFFSRYLMKSLGVKSVINSPTFTILNKYSGKFDFYHFDMYRITDVEEAIEMGAEDIICNINKNNIVLIEWSEKILQILPKNYIAINITKIDDSKRLVEINDFNN